MRIKAKRFISLCLAFAIIATSVGYGPPAVGAEYMPYIELEEDASIATPSDAIRPATPSEALPPEEKATPFEAEKRFIRVEPEEVPEYYQKASYAGRKFWKFDDRYGDEHYREFGFIQREAEFPLWYEANNQGRVEDYLSINPDEEYYDLAPYVYTSIKPENEDWDILSGHVLTGMKTLFKKEKIKFKNWDSSSYDVWALTTFEADNEDGNEELSFYFYGKIKNEGEEGSGAEWYYADKNGNVLNKLISRSIRSLRSVYQLGLYFDIPWQLNSTKPNNTYDVTNQKTYNLPGLFDYGSNKSTHFGWVEGRNRAGNYADSSSGTTVFYNQDPAKVSTYASGRLYSQKYTIDLEKTYTSEYGAVWCPQDADVFIFCKQFENVSKGDFTTGNNYCIDTQAILVKRNTEFYASAAGIPKRDGFTFKGWYYYKSIIGGDVERVNIADDEKLIAGSSQKFTFIFPDWEANLNTVIFKDWDGTILSEQKIYSGNPAIAPILPEIPGKVFTGWSKSFSSVVSDMEIVAQYADVINVTINGNGGTVYGNEIYTMQAKIGKSWSSQLEGLVDNLKKEGSTFNKLYYLIDGTEYSLPQFVESQDITIYVKWNRNQYKIIFDGNGGVSGTKTSVTTYAYYGDPALPPTPPVFTRQYRDFMGFANVKLNGVPITYETIVTGDATYYAMWDYHNTDIVYHDCIPDSEWTATVTRWSGDSSQFSHPIHPARAGYSGPYWYTEPDGKGSVLYTFGENLKALLDGKDTLDVYALWNLVNYKYFLFKNTAQEPSTFTTFNYNVTMDDADLPEWEGENGKIFIGYSTSKTGGGNLYKRNSDLPLVSSTYLYAQYANASYTVTFKDWDGTILNTQEVDYGKDAVLPVEPVREGYGFIGWDKPSTNIQSDTVINAKYSKLYQIFFKNNCFTDETSYKKTWFNDVGVIKDISNPSYVKNLDVSYWDLGENIKEFTLPNPDQSGAIFLGWTRPLVYPLSAGYSFGTLANWKFSAPQLRGGPVSGSNLALEHNTKPSNSIEDVIPGFALISGGHKTQVRALANKNDATSLTLRGIWIPDDRPSLILINGFDDYTTYWTTPEDPKYTSVLEENVPFIESISVGKYGQGIMETFYQGVDERGLPRGLVDYKNSDLTDYAQKRLLIGYFSEPDGKGNRLDTTYVYTKPNNRYYAYWVLKDSIFNVIYKDDTGNTIGKETVKAGEKCVQIPVAPEKKGYRFVGWEADNENSSINQIIRDTTLTAKYEKIIAAKYKLTLSGNGGTVDGSVSEEHIVDEWSSIDNILSESAVKASKSFYSFEGWYTQPAGGTRYPELGNSMPDSDLTLYAHWTRTSNEVVYQDWDGAIIDRQEVTIGGNATPPADPERLGYTFTGWDKESTNIQANTTITAKYNKNSYKLTLDGNGGTLAGKNTREQQLAYGDSFDQILAEGAAELSQKYYTFAGWYTDKNGGSKYTGSGNIMPASNVTVYAHWTRTSNEVVYQDWDETIIDRQEIAIGENATPPADPSRTGYTFTGWDKESTNIQANTTITAQYSKNSYKLTLDGNGGTLNGKDTREQQLAYGDTFDQILTEGAAGASQKYYTFTGWYTDKTGGSKYPGSGNIMPASNVTVYAHWTRTSNEVIYKDWDGRIIDRQDVAIGENATPPADPSRTGFTFTGWDKESTNIQANTTITAQYSKNSYKLTLDGNGGMIGGNASTDQVVTYGESFDQILSEGAAKASQKYYTFAGWYTEKTGGSQYPGSGNTMPASNVTVYAHWTRTSNEVIYKDWDERVIDRQEIAIGGNATPPADPSRMGFTFSGWDKSSTNIQANTTITAQYSKNSYKLILDGNGGTLNGKDTREHQLAYGDSFDQILAEGAAKASQEYYTFAGWYTDKTGGSKYPGSGNIMPASNVTVYAHWTRTSNEVIYKDWDERVIDRQEIAIGGNATPPADPERLGYTFTGWDKESTNIQANTTITAKYSKNSYKLTLDGNGGTLAGKDTREQQLAYGDTFDQILAEGATEASQKYYTFAGWYTDKTGGSKYPGSGNTMPASNVTVYAHWTRTSNEVIYKDWDERVIDRQEIAIGGNATPPADPERLGYTFTGWDKESTNIQANTTITAQYSKNSYKLTLDGNGGSLNGKNTREQQLAYGDTFDQILIDGWNEVSRPGYTFIGWYSAPIGGDSYLNKGNRMPSNDLIVYAHWEIIQFTIHFDKNLNAVEKNPEDKIVAYGGVVGNLPIISAEEFTFLGWYTEPNGGTKVVESTPVSGNTTYYAHWDTAPKPTEPEPSKPESRDEEEIITVPVPPSIDSNAKPTVPDTGGTFEINPDNPYEVTYTKPDGTTARDEWVGDGVDWYHVDEAGKLSYDWYLEGEKTWYKLNKEPGKKFGAALICWNYEPMDGRKYFFDPTTTKMLTGWQKIDEKWYYFTERNEAQTYYGSNPIGWLYDPTKPGKPYGSMYKNEFTPDGYLVDENGVWTN